LVCAVGLAVGVAQAAAAPVSPRIVGPVSPRIVGPVSPRIVGGTPASPGTWPSLAFIENSLPGGGYYLCTGTIVAPNVVLTAGHCAVDESTMTVYPPQQYGVVTGSLDWTDAATRQLRPVSRVVVYPGFLKIAGSNGELYADGDAALLQLEIPTAAPAMPLASDPGDSGLYASGTAAAIAGWGLTSAGGSTPDQLQWAITVVQSSTYCTQQANDDFGALFDSFDQTCAIDAPTDAAGTCQGDSGGPLVAASADGGIVQIGITSWAQASCSTTVPDFFTRTDVLSAWITRWLAAMAPPTVTTTRASSVGQTSAQLNGQLNPNGSAITYYFQWGTSTAYTNTSGTGSTNDGVGMLPVGINITGLSPGTTYHYRLVGSSFNGTTYGADQTFTTTLPRMQPAKARSYARQTLAGAFGRRFKRGHQYTASCHRLGPIRFRCNVAWSYGANYYYGRVTVYYVSGLRGTVEWSDAYTMSWVNDRCYFYSGHPQRCAVHSARGSW